MNKLTKEELRKLLYGLGFINDIPCTVLENKIQSMIDLYCDHIWTDGSGSHIYCALCHAYGGKR